MKLCVLANLFGPISLDEDLAKLKALGVEAVEIGAGGYPGKAQCNPAELLADDKKLQEFLDTFKKYDIELAALACHGNPVHPDKEIAARYDEDLRNAILLAEKIGVDTIVTFSGCPGGSPEDKMPNWAICSWPTEFSKVLEYQWNEVLIPYWKELGAFAESHHVTRLAFEMHPGFCVYNPDTLMRLRKEVGPVIGANFDPSHLIWQGIEPAAAIRYLGDAIYHVHAKDTKIDPINCARSGVLDTKHYSDEINRSWVFRTVGYGHGEDWWRELISNLRLVGYDRVLSIEHEDSLMTIDEGLSQAVKFLKANMIKEPKPGTMSWA
jgi:sugar phosphate isomerase/epimerase